MVLTDGGTVKCKKVLPSHLTQLTDGDGSVPPSVQGRGTPSTIFHGLYKPLNCRQFGSEVSSNQYRQYMIFSGVIH